MATLNSKKKELAKLDALLDRLSLKKTRLRKGILLAFSKAKKPMSQAEVMDFLSDENDTVDRVSVYRNLIQLKKAGVIHEVDVNSYVFCSHDCDEHAHLLLFCQKCHRHQEIKDHEHIDKFIASLNGFRFFGQKQAIFLKGLCSSCTV